MMVLAGTLLALSTWALGLLVVVLLGLLPASLTSRSRSSAIQGSMWWGLALTVAYVLCESLLVPLGSHAGLLMYLCLAICLGIPGLWRLHSLPSTPRARLRSGTDYLLLAGITLAIVYMAVSVTGPVTNYDTGLYHLGAIHYQQDWGLIPGLANLYFPLGYGNSVVTLGAFAGSTPWSGNGFRLLNGFLMVLMGVDLLMRLRRERRGPGFYLLVLSVAFAWIPLVALSDYWVVSPTSDSSVLILTTVSVAFLCEGVGQGTSSVARVRALAISVILALVMLTMRPTMVVFTGAVVAVAILVLIKDRGSISRQPKAEFWLTGSTVVALGAVLLVAQAARDRILSGWWQYPLSFVHFDVPWSAPDPVGFRTATLGAARNPADLWPAAESWDWSPGWLSRVPTQWECAVGLCLVVASLVMVTLAVRTSASWSPRRLVLAALPSAAATVAWFVASPPSFRFVWGPLFTLLALPAAFALSAVAKRSLQTRRLTWISPLAVGGVSVALIGAVTFCAIARSHLDTRTQDQVWSVGPISVPYRVAPIVVAATTASTLPSGLRVLSPTESDQCWAAYPLCTPQMDPHVSLAGSTFGQGFLP